MAKPMRKIVIIDEDTCDGCGLCVPSCAEGAIQVIDGKAKLVAENLCDGIGNCLGTCPRGAITIEDRPAESFDAQAAQEHVRKLRAKPAQAARGACSCPGTLLRKLSPSASPPTTCPAEASARPSRLAQFPVQLALLPNKGSLWDQADVLISADCVGFVMPDFHETLLAPGRGDHTKTLAIACPKLDDISGYVEKLASIFANNDIRSITVAHMEVPCCNGIVVAVEQALDRASRSDIPVLDVLVAIDGRIIEEK
jgi:NAD-dependent dihydropyrimidine dehydrogenase PreA subunit